jgi:hypothetical protein
LNETEQQHTDKDVYFIRMVSTPYVKIGYSGVVLQRLKQLSTGNAFKLKLEYKFRSSQFRLHESMLHAHFVQQHVSGEWFDLPESTDYDGIVRELCNPE